MDTYMYMWNQCIQTNLIESMLLFHVDAINLCDIMIMHAIIITLIEYYDYANQSSYGYASWLFFFECKSV